MRYKNLKSGNVIDVNSELLSPLWVSLDDLKNKEKDLQDDILETRDQGGKVGHFTEESLREMDWNDLRKLAKEFDVEASKKDDIIAELLDVEVPEGYEFEG